MRKSCYVHVLIVSERSVIGRRINISLLVRDIQLIVCHQAYRQGFLSLIHDKWMVIISCRLGRDFDNLTIM